MSAGAAEIGARLTLRHTDAGVPYVRPSLGVPDPATGRPMRVYRSFPGMTDEQAMAAAAEWLSSVVGGGDLPSLVAAWIDSCEADGRAGAATSAKRRSLLRLYVEPAWRGRRPDEVTPMDVSNLELALLRRDGRDGRGLSRQTVNAVHWMLSACYKWLSERGFASGVPTRGLRAPRPERRAVEPPTEEACLALRAWLYGEAGRLLADPGRDAAGTRRLVSALAALVAVDAGLRQGEALGLRVRDLGRRRRELVVAGSVRVEGGRAVRGATKTGSSMRTVAVDRRLHALLSEGWLPARRGLGPHGDADPLLSEDGSWERPSRVRAGWYALRADFAGTNPDAAGVAKLRFHDLRHIHASLLLAEGTDLKEVSARLGHADTGVTTEIYGHVMPGHDQRVADAWGRLMGDPGEE